MRMFLRSNLRLALRRSEKKLKMANVFSNILVMLLSPSEQDTEGEHSESPALNGPAGQGVATPFHDFSEVVGRRYVFKQAP